VWHQCLCVYRPDRIEREENGPKRANAEIALPGIIDNRDTVVERDEHEPVYDRGGARVVTAHQTRGRNAVDNKQGAAYHPPSRYMKDRYTIVVVGVVGHEEISGKNTSVI